MARFGSGADPRANFHRRFRVDGSDTPRTSVIFSGSGLVTPGVSVELRFEPLPLPTSGSAKFQIVRRADVSRGARPHADRAPSSGNGLDELAHTSSSTGFGPSTVQDSESGERYSRRSGCRRGDWPSAPDRAVSHVLLPSTRSLVSGVSCRRGRTTLRADGTMQRDVRERAPLRPEEP